MFFVLTGSWMVLADMELLELLLVLLLLLLLVVLAVLLVLRILLVGLSDFSGDLLRLLIWRSFVVGDLDS